MKHTLGITGAFFRESSVDNWKKAADAGFTNIEVGLNRNLALTTMYETAEKLYRDSKTAGLHAYTLHLPFGHEWDISTANTAHRRQILKKQLDAVAWGVEHGMEIGVLHASYEPIGDDERENRLVICRDSILELGTEAKKLGMRIAVEDLPRTCLGHNGKELVYLTDNGKNAGVCFDFNHLLLESHEEFLKAAGHLIITTHISDYDGVDERHWLCGNGCIDFRLVTRTMEQMGYTGQWLFEMDGDKAVPGEIIGPETLMKRWKEIMK